MSREPKGFLVNDKPYKISGTNYPSVSLSLLTKLKKGDKVYQEIMPNGIVLLIPEKLYLENK